MSFEFLDFVKTPMSLHSTLPKVSDEMINREEGLAAHFLKTYSNSKENIKWPK